jgi:pyruvate/2-oxoglutarate dehydrogenase complex dihydrolipoamide acyltransferase (E2) component
VPPGPEPRGKWWSPAVIGIAVLLLLALLGVGVWLIVKNADSSSGTPAPTATATTKAPATTEATTTPTTEPTATATTTEPTGPAAVTVPALKGLSSADARQALDRTGLSYRLRFVTSTDADPGTVIDCDPAEGEQVPPDTTVTLIIAVAPSSSPTATSTPSTTAPTDTTNQDGN